MSAIINHGAVTGSPGRPGSVTAGSQPPRWSFLAALLVCVGVVAFAVRNVFLFSDDYAFLGQAKLMPFGLEYLAADLFGHFSPISRLVNTPMVELLGQHPGLLYWALLAMTAGVQASIFLLLLVMFGRSWYALVGAVLLSTSLTLVPLAIWWTAGLNILPAMAGSALCLAGTVRLVQGRSGWWGALAITGYLVAVLDYESTMVMAGYAALWVVLFRTRLTHERLWPLLVRTWWLWAGFFVIGGLTLLNYRINYYVPGLPAPASAIVDGMAVSLFETVLPALLGFHDPDSLWFAATGTVVGVLVLAWLLAVTLTRRHGAWRGWLFAAIGWAIPSGALVINRVGLHGTWVATLPFYFFLPTMLVVLGILAALTGRDSRPRSGHAESGRGVAGADQVPRRAASTVTDPVRQRVRLAGTVTAVVVVTAWLFSAGPSVQSIQTFGAQINNVPPPTGEFVDNLRRSAQLFSASTGPITVLNSDVPFALVPPAYGPYNRADWVAELNDIPLDFDQLDRPTYAISDDGTLTPASIDWRYELAVSTGTEPGLTIAGANDLHSESGGGVCFQATSSTNLGWVLPAPVSGERIVVRSLVTVDAPTVQRLVVLPSDSQSYEVANYDKKAWQPGLSGLLDTVMSSSVTALSFDSLTPGSNVCLSGIAIGLVTVG